MQMSPGSPMCQRRRLLPSRSDPTWLLLLHGQMPSDTISARMSSAASLGFGVRLVNK
jgi:hypothetical protein